MRKSLRLPLLLAALVAAALLGRWVMTNRPAPTPVPAPVQEVAPAPAPPPDAQPPTGAAPPGTEAPPAQTAEAPPAEPPLPPVPEVPIGNHPIHEVPVDRTPEPPPGRPLDLSHGGRTVGQSPEVALGPSAAPPPSAPRQFSGKATPTGGVAMQVGTTSVQLFGIKLPGAGDHCGNGEDSNCGVAAQHALAKQLGATGQVSCHVPNVKPGIVVAYAICLDANGVDLGGYLISTGLALADTGQSYDYVGAESIARNLKQGLWHSR
ncbi:MAG TPA: hypothetical protein VM689_16690 [Aliidongia sp.]|nr:hypothetical protein [Aliidongia sp.]